MPSSPLAPSAHVASLHVGGPESLGLAGAAQWFDEPWTTAIFKRPIAGPVDVGPLGLAGDGHADLVNHGGLDKAICVYPVAHYPAWQAELGRADFTEGAFGENLSVTGLTEGDVCIGDIFSIGTEPQGLRVQVSQPRQPCWKLARKWQVKDLTAQAVASASPKARMIARRRSSRTPMGGMVGFMRDGVVWRAGNLQRMRATHLNPY